MTRNDFLRMLKVAAETDAQPGPPQYSISSFYEALPTMKEDNPLWKAYTDEMDKSVIGDAVGDKAKELLAAAKTGDEGWKWNLDAVRNNMQNEQARWGKNTEDFINGYNSWKTWNPVTWAYPSVTGKKILRPEDITARMDAWKDKFDNAKSLYDRISTWAAWRADQDALSRYVSGELAGVDSVVAPATRVWENSLIGGAFDTATKAVTLGHKKGLADLTMDRDAQGRPMNADRLTTEFGRAYRDSLRGSEEEKLYGEEWADRKARNMELAVNASGWTLSAGNTALEMMLPGAKATSWMAPLTGGLSVQDKLRSVKAVGKAAPFVSKLGPAAAKAADMGIKAWRWAKPTRVAAEAVENMATMSGKEDGGAVAGTAGAIKRIAGNAPTLAALGGATGTLIPTMSNPWINYPVQWITNTGAYVLGTDNEAKTMFADAITGGPDKGAIGVVNPNNGQGTDVRQEMLDQLNDKDTDDFYRNKYDILQTAPVSQVAEKRMEDFINLRTANAQLETRRILDSSFDWDNATDEQVAAKMAQYTPEQLENAKFNAYFKETQRGDAMSPNLFTEELSDLTPQHRDALFENWLQSTYKGVTVGTDAGAMSTMGNAVKGALSKDNSMIQAVMRSTPENRAVVLNYAKDKVLRQMYGQGTPENTPDAQQKGWLSGLMDKYVKQPLAGKFQNDLLNECTEEELKYIFDDAVRNAPNAKSVLALREGGGVNKRVSEYVTKRVIDRAVTDGNFGSELHAELAKSMADGEPLEPALQEYFANRLKTANPETFFSKMDGEHFDMFTRAILANGGGDGTASPIDGISDEDWAKLKTSWLAAAKSRAWKLALSNPFKNVPMLFNLFGTMRGWNADILDSMKNPWMFWGATTMLLGGGFLVGRALLSDDEEDEDDESSGRGGKKTMAEQLQRQRELLADNTSDGMI